MADDPSKTEKATPKRRNKVRNEGNVPKSQEMAKTVTVIAGTLGLFMYFGVMFKHISQIFVYILGNASTMVLNKEAAQALFSMVVFELAIIVMPVLLFIGLAAYVCLRLQVGSLWTTKVFGFKWENFNLVNGLKRMFFSAQTFIRLAKSFLLACVIGVVPYYFIMSEFSNFLPMYYTDAATLGAYMMNTGLKMVMYTLGLMLIISAVDLWYTRYSYEERIKMTKQELKDEARQAEGDPMIKQKQKQKMFQVMSNRMLKEIPKADVVITNPTHYAVALRYDPTEGMAPMVVAKGVDHLAEKIKTIARENHVPIRENRLLARSLYKSVEVGEMIPEDLYKAVASILAQVWKMKGKMPGQGER